MTTPPGSSVSPAIELFDSHCHLNYDYAPKTEADLIREAMEAGVSTLVTIGVDLDTIVPVQAISERYSNVFHTVGVHPHEAITVQPGDLDRIRQAAKHPKCRAIGEIGLDYHYDHSPRDVQRRVLEEQLELALELGQPVIIHSRDAEPELLESLTAYAHKHARKAETGQSPGVIHCFSGSHEFGKSCLDLGFLISFSGILTFKSAESLRTSAREFPLDRLLIETDSPYLAPIPFRGRKCEPSMVKLTALKIAELKGIKLEEVARVTTATAKQFFRIESA